MHAFLMMNSDRLLNRNFTHEYSSSGLIPKSIVFIEQKTSYNLKINDFHC